MKRLCWVKNIGSMLVLSCLFCQYFLFIYNIFESLGCHILKENVVQNRKSNAEIVGLIENIGSFERKRREACRRVWNRREFNRIKKNKTEHRLECFWTMTNHRKEELRRMTKVLEGMKNPTSIKIVCAFWTICRKLFCCYF